MPFSLYGGKGFYLSVSIMKKLSTILSLLAVLLLSIVNGSTSLAQTHEVLITTNMGNMRVMLYDDCPRTVNNFLKKVRAGYYDDSLFGRVMPTFMIQGGAPDSKTALPGQSIGWGDLSEEIPAEIHKNHVPKKGALCAPHREGVVNSDMSMFFIVDGYVMSEATLNNWEKTHNASARKAAQRKVMTQAVKDSLAMLKTTSIAEYNQLARRINHDIDSIARSMPGTRFFTQAEREAYSTVGGAYHIYGEYTCYGEVVEGLDVISKIAALESNAANRPKTDVRMKIRVIK